jgi:bifunctional UDP-N-acetylglucosamine pyrophosphorylase/glucosamine-1-phosphate N-acetyltransferase|tara:strand:- start:431 stop:1786 length:1356 start_codon:yes stop_codon:yes gene_type:complete
MNLNIIILAAGNGKRMHSSIPKVMHKIGGKTMLEHVILSAEKLKPNSINVVINSKTEHIKSNFSKYKVDWHIQLEQKGTADAVKTVLPDLKKDDHVLILYADTPLIDYQLLNKFINYLPQSHVKVLTVELKNPFGYGRIIREQAETEKILSIIEESEADAMQKKIKECNTGIVFSNVGILEKLISEVKNNNSKEEYYLTDIVSIASNKNYVVAPLLAKESNSLLGVNDKFQLENTEQIYQNNYREKFLKQGVTMLDSKSVFFRGDIEIGVDVELDANVILEGNVKLENNIKIMSNTIIKDSKVMNNTVIKSHSIIEDSIIGESCNIGPFARIRPNCDLGKNVGIGNFVEVKASTIKSNTKANHLSYIGDSEIGENVNIGAGVITCNYDGVKKHKTIIKDNVFIGSDSQLIAPIIVEEGVTIAAGSTITDNSEKDSLLIARSRQQEKKNWKK